MIIVGGGYIFLAEDMYYPINYEYIKEIIASNEKEQYFYFEIIM